MRECINKMVRRASGGGEKCFTNLKRWRDVLHEKKKIYATLNQGGMLGNDSKLFFFLIVSIN